MEGHCQREGHHSLERESGVGAILRLLAMGLEEDWNPLRERDT
jgi:hypothetical protein